MSPLLQKFVTPKSPPGFAIDGLGRQSGRFSTVREIDVELALYALLTSDGLPRRFVEESALHTRIGDSAILRP